MLAQSCGVSIRPAWPAWSSGTWGLAGVLVRWALELGAPAATPRAPGSPRDGGGGDGVLRGTLPSSCISGNINVLQVVPGGPQAVPRRSSGVRLGPLTDRVPEYDAFQK